MMESAVGGASNNDGNMSTGRVSLLLYLIRVYLHNLPTIKPESSLPVSSRNRLTIVSFSILGSSMDT